MTRRVRRWFHQDALVPAERTADTPPVWEQLRPWLDAAMDEPHAVDREVVLLRCFYTLSHREIGDRLGVTENTAREGRNVQKVLLFTDVQRPADLCDLRSRLVLWFARGVLPRTQLFLTSPR